MSTAGIIKVSAACPIFDGQDYPKWKVMMKKRLLAMNSELWTVTEIGLTDLCKMANADDIRKYTHLDITAKDIICSCLSIDDFRRVKHLCNAKLIWVGFLMSMRVIELVKTHGSASSKNLLKQCPSNQIHQIKTTASWLVVSR